MKKIIGLVSLLLLVLTFMSCADSSRTNATNKPEILPLKAVIYPNGDYKNDLSNKEYLSVFNTFTNGTTKELFTDFTNNQIYSPMSLYMALAMLTEGGNGETLTELLTLLNVENKEELGEMMSDVYVKNYFELPNSGKYEDSEETADKLYFKNSLWINEPSVVLDSYVERIKEKYFSEIYKASLVTNSAKKAICEWINKNTENLLEVKENELDISDDVALIIFNTIYYKGTWNKEYYSAGKLVFYGKGNEIETPFIQKSSTFDYLKNKYFTMVNDYLSDSKIRFSLFLPNGDYTTDDLIGNYLSEVLGAINSKERVSKELEVLLPEFDVTSSYSEIKKQLTTLGLEQALGDTPEYYDISNADLYVDSIIQKARFSLNKYGIEAAAFTAIIIAKESVGIPPITDKIVFDRPFVFVLSNEDGIPLFIGMINNF